MKKYIDIAELEAAFREQREKAFAAAMAKPDADPELLKLQSGLDEVLLGYQRWLADVAVDAIASAAISTVANMASSFIVNAAPPEQMVDAHGEFYSMCFQTSMALFGAPTVDGLTAAKVTVKKHLPQ